MSVPSKADQRAHWRQWRRALGDRADRSHRITAALIARPDVRAARSVTVFTTIPGEPDMAEFTAWLTDRGVAVSVPESLADQPARGVVADPVPDVVIVPGLAFTADGDRLGQGGGWYDRFLATLPPTSVTIGVCFAEQVVESVPVEPHDVRVDVVVTDL